MDLTDPIFHDEAKAMAHIEADRWPDGVNCPFCGSVNVHRMEGKTQAGMFLCNDCRDKFTVRTKTIFERSHIPLHKWLMATHIMAASKKSVSALQLQRMLGLGSYKSAWFMCHRIREAMKPAKVGPLGGEGKIIEADETYIGGKETNKHVSKREKGNLGGKGKQVVFALVERDGMSHSFHVAKISGKDLRPFIVENVSRKSSLMTDEGGQYYHVGKEFARHETVNHGADEYVRGDAYTNTAEGRFALMKRAVYGAHHSISEAHLPRYLTEWDFKWNTRKMKDGERAALALKGAKGKRLTYRYPQPTGEGPQVH
jgi:transposase-like protein